MTMIKLNKEMHELKDAELDQVTGGSALDGAKNAAGAIASAVGGALGTLKAAGDTAYDLPFRCQH